MIYGEFFRQADRICFWTACHNFWTFLQSAAKLGTKQENKDNLEGLLILKAAKKILQRKSKLKVCKTEKKQNMAEPVKNRPAGSK